MESNNSIEQFYREIGFNNDCERNDFLKKLDFNFDFIKEDKNYLKVTLLDDSTKLNINTNKKELCPIGTTF